MNRLQSYEVNEKDEESKEEAIEDVPDIDEVGTEPLDLTFRLMSVMSVLDSLTKCKIH